MDCISASTEEKIKKKLEKLLRKSKHCLEFKERCCSEFHAMGIQITVLNSFWLGNVRAVDLGISGYPELISVSITL